MVWGLRRRGISLCRKRTFTTRRVRRVQPTPVRAAASPAPSVPIVELRRLRRRVPGEGAGQPRRAPRPGPRNAVATVCFHARLASEPSSADERTALSAGTGYRRTAGGRGQARDRSGTGTSPRSSPPATSDARPAEAASPSASRASAARPTLPGMPPAPTSPEDCQRRQAALASGPPTSGLAGGPRGEIGHGRLATPTRPGGERGRTGSRDVAPRPRTDGPAGSRQSLPSRRPTVAISRGPGSSSGPAAPTPVRRNTHAASGAPDPTAPGW